MPLLVFKGREWLHLTPYQSLKGYLRLLQSPGANARIVADKWALDHRSKGPSFLFSWETLGIG